MIGQGRPNASRLLCVSPAGIFAASLVLGLLLAVDVASARDPTTMRLRIAWGGGPERPWHGQVTIADGTLSDVVALGIESDEPGSLYLDEAGRVAIRGRSPRSYDGFDVTVTASLDAVMIVEVFPESAAEHAEALHIVLADLIAEAASQPLDGDGNRLFVRRAPGDRLRVNFTRDTLIFTPGEPFSLELEPYLLGLSPGSKFMLRAELHEARGGPAVWSEDLAEVAQTEEPSTGPIALEVPLPQAEGVYDLLIRVVRRSLRMRLGLSQTLVERKVQVVVLDRQPPAPSEAKEGSWHQVVEINPATPRWWDRLANLPWIPSLRRGPLGSGDSHLWRHPLGEVVQLGDGVATGNISWEAYPLPISEPGRPHLLEVDFPSDVPQHTGISVIEPNAAGDVMPIGLDSGFYVSDEAAETTPHWLKHRLLFTPRTRSPLVLITNRRDGDQAVYGKIRVLAVDGDLPRSDETSDPRSERLLAGYMARPLFPENFSASDSLDAWSGRALDDWRTFYEGADRLVRYLHYAGCNGVMMSVLADGSAIYPSAKLQSTPRYDTGIFFDSGQDPLRKDVLELVLTMFDRDKLRLIPSLQFSAPLPELEDFLRRGGAEAEGIEWVGSDGQTWLTHRQARHGTAPYYNTLDPRVQEAMLSVVRELVKRYGRHPSMVGLAIQLSPDGYAQLPGPQWGFDGTTLARFQREMNVSLDTKDLRAVRTALLEGEHKEVWLAWRNDTLKSFYQRMQQELSEASPAAKLYLCPAESLDAPYLQSTLRPTLPRQPAVDVMLQRIGIDPADYVDMENIVLLRPQRLAPGSDLASRTTHVRLNQSPDWDRHQQSADVRASVFYHEPQQARLASFDAKSPFRNTYAWLLSHPSPAGDANRKRFIHSIATADSQEMFDGGWMLPLGQEDTLRELFSVYRRLPPGGFMTIEGDTQPVTIRKCQVDDGVVIYLANDSPWQTTVRIQVTAAGGCQSQRVGECDVTLPVFVEGSADWSVPMKPYQLAAVEFSDAHVQLTPQSVALAPGVVEALQTQIQDLGARAAALSSPPEWHEPAMLPPLPCGASKS